LTVTVTISRDPHADVNVAADDEGPWRSRVVSRSLGASIQQAIDRSEAFLVATTELLATAGDSITVQDIADRAGMSLRLLYRYFESKDDLFAAVLEEALRKGGERIRAIVEEANDASDGLRRFLYAAVDVETSPTNVALARHESNLVLVRPDAVSYAQFPIAEVAAEVVGAVGAPPGSAFLVMVGKGAFNYSRMFGNELGLDTPSADEFVEFHLRACGVTEDDVA
jgi:AcrR family transcriptional regulator